MCCVVVLRALVHNRVPKESSPLSAKVKGQFTQTVVPLAQMTFEGEHAAIRQHPPT